VSGIVGKCGKIPEGYPKGYEDRLQRDERKIPIAKRDILSYNFKK
jgi:hypothetical protein